MCTYSRFGAERTCVETLVFTGPHQQKHRDMLSHHTGEQTHPHLSRPPHSERGGTDFCHAASPSCFDRRSRNLRWGGAFMRVMPRWAPGCCDTSYPPLPTVRGQSRWRPAPGFKNHNMGHPVKKNYTSRGWAEVTERSSWSQNMFTCSQTLKNVLLPVLKSAENSNNSMGLWQAGPNISTFFIKISQGWWFFYILTGILRNHGPPGPCLSLRLKPSLKLSLNLQTFISNTSDSTTNQCHWLLMIIMIVNKPNPEFYFLTSPLMDSMCRASVRLPATTIASCLPLSARSLPGSSLLCAIRATRKQEADKRRAFAHTGMAEKRAQQSFGTPGVHGGDGTGAGRGGQGRQHTYEYSWRVGNVVRRISTNQGVNMTLAQKPTVREIN